MENRHKNKSWRIILYLKISIANIHQITDWRSNSSGCSALSHDMSSCPCKQCHSISGNYFSWQVFTCLIECYHLAIISTLKYILLLEELWLSSFLSLEDNHLVAFNYTPLENFVYILIVYSVGSPMIMEKCLISLSSYGFVTKCLPIEESVIFWSHAVRWYAELYWHRFVPSYKHFYATLHGGSPLSVYKLHCYSQVSH